MSHLPTHPILDGFAFHGTPPSRQEQLFRYLHGAIASGLLKSGARLPPTRHVAEQLGISRQTVVIAYERLLAEGMIEGQQGSGSFVAPIASPIASRAATLGETGAFRQSRRSRAIADATTDGTEREIPPLRPGIPDLSDFPSRVIGRIAARYWRAESAKHLDYGDGAGSRDLREAVSNFLRTFRGVPCSADQIIITNGTQSSIITAAHVVADPGDHALVENPGYSMTHKALILSGLKLVPVPVDRDGIHIDGTDRTMDKARLIVCTPSHHYPLGVTTPLERRLELLNWADRADGVVVEDDYDSEFRYSGAPLPSLAALDQGRGRVIYAGTFSKLLAPGLRLGFLVVPDRLIDAFRSARSVLDRHASVPIQQICAEFIAGGHLAAHVKRMRPLYAERRAALLEGLRRAEEAGRIELVGTDTGLHACALMKSAAAERKAFEIAREMSLGVIKLSDFTAPGGKILYWGLAMGYATTDAATTRRLAAKFAERLLSA